ncbi:TonB-dependent receptor [Sphingomonas aracearum]|uniref:TonB-dependent receptor n=2 Tax=Sphingomonas aracearum TaxID=2283317 RepID=A0A369W614_9SPHN|nr:TonB-dependent receptor [Sphingomonas aracearum]
MGQGAGATPPEQAAAAAEAPASASDQDVVVVGTRASLQSAINRKRNAGTVVDSIVADDIASFPDKNVGDSLARVTGVQLSRDFGEGTKVSIRGVEPDLNRVEINGVSQTSATGERSGDFRELATELVKSIDVYKGYAVDLTEGGLGGTVSVETRKPLELKKALGTLVFSEQHLDTTRDWRPRATVVLGTPKFLIDGLGVLLNVTYDDKTTRQDYISNTQFNRFADFDRSDSKTVVNPTYANFNTYASCAGVTGNNAANATANRLACETQFFDWIPTSVRYRNLVRRDKRLSGDFTVQYEFAHNFRAFAEAQINNRNQNLSDTNYSIDTSRFERFQTSPALAAAANGATSRPQILPGTATVDGNHVVTSWTNALNTVNIGSAAAPNYNGASNILGVQRRDFDYDQKSKYFLGGFDWDLDRVQVKFLASHATARTINNTNLVSYSTGVSGIGVDRRNDLGLPVFVYPGSIDPADPGIYSNLTRRGADGQLLVPSGPTVQYRPSDLNNTENQLKLDVDWEMDYGPLKSIEYGGQYREQKFLNYLNGGSRLLSAPGVTPLVYQTDNNQSFTTVIQPTVTNRRVGNTFYLTPAEYQSLIASNTGISGGAPLFTGLSVVPANAPSRIAVPNFDESVLGQYYDLSRFNQDLIRFSDGLPQIPNVRINETVAAAYLKFNLDTEVLGMRLTGNGGVRYLHTTDEGTGTNISRVTRRNAANTGNETVVLAAQQLSLKNSYTDWLPAFNLALEITPDLVLRGNWAKNLARPRPTDLVPNINCVDDQTLAVAGEQVCTAGNPDLVPYRADQWEANLSWYPNKDTLVSLGYYKKYESSFVVNNVTRSNVDLFRDGNLFTVRQAINGFGALLDGVEASAQTAFTWLPKPFDGLGASGNVTWARAIRTNLTNAATGAPLDEYPGLSKWTYNASIFYDKGFLNARLSYNYRSDWLVTIADSTNGNLPIYRQGEGYLDGKITFRFPEWHYSLFMEMQNIGKEYSRSYVKGLATSEVYYPGQRFFAGVQFKF